MAILNNTTVNGTLTINDGGESVDVKEQLAQLNSDIDDTNTEINNNVKWVRFNKDTEITLPSSGTYLILTGHNSTSNLNGMWIYRPGNSAIWAIREASGVTITANGTSIKITASSGTPNCYYNRIE